jgi:hypothetical protein
VQIIEVGDLDVRSAVIRLRRRGTPLQFVFYRMVHIGRPAFYAKVSRRLKAAGVIVAEGVHGPSSVVCTAPTLSYRVARFNRRAGLVEQDLDTSTVSACRSSGPMSAPASSQRAGAEQEASAELMPELDEALGGERDSRLLAALARIHEKRSTEDIEVAVVYGAAHVAPAVHALNDRYGYKARSAEWITVVDL